MYKRIMLLLLIAGFALFGVMNIAEASTQSFFTRYCEDADNPDASPDKMYFVTPGQEKEICLYFYTSSPTPIELSYYFPDTTLNSQGNKSCATKEGSKIFGKYFLNNTGERTITVSAEKPTMVKEKILIPIGMSGELNGCLAYNLSKPVNASEKGNEMFSVIVRKVGFLSLFIGSNESIKNEVQLLRNAGGSYSTNSRIKVKMQDDALVLSFLVRNNGNVSQNISITGMVYNIFGFEKTFESAPVNVGPGETKEIEANAGIVPAYKGFFTVKSMMQNTPVFGFDTSNMDEKYKTSGSQTETGTIYIFSWISLIVILLVIAFILRIVVPRKAKIVKQ